MTSSAPKPSMPMLYGELIPMNESYVEDDGDDDDSPPNPPISPQIQPKPKKLLVLNLNGFLIRRVYVKEFYQHRFITPRIPEYRYRDFMLFKRPYSHQFLRFCLARFQVGIWSSAKQYNIDGALKCSIGNLADKLLFVWNQHHCVESDFRTLDNPEKPFYIKELEKVWKQYPFFSATSTLMIDNKPCKAIFNPPNTGIFTSSYDIDNPLDDLLHPDGDLCKYLQLIALADNVQEFVEENRFGLLPITSCHPEWPLYKRIRWRASPYLKLGTFGELIKVKHEDEEESVSEPELPVNPQIESTKRKLLILNLNGLLMKKIHLRDMENIVTTRTPDFVFRNSLLFKRPFSKEFVRFCLERFQVAIWSSVAPYDLDGAITCAIGGLKEKLHFIWDSSKCKDTGFPSLENIDKPLYLKEMSKVWGDRKIYSPANTLMIDDKPYKSLPNPAHTAIFTKSYEIDNEKDNLLHPNGELCNYLEKVAEAEDSAKYIEKHPFGLPPIKPGDQDWKYYKRVFHYT